MAPKKQGPTPEQILAIKARIASAQTIEVVPFPCHASNCHRHRSLSMLARYTARKALYISVLYGQALWMQQNTSNTAPWGCNKIPLILPHGAATKYLVITAHGAGAVVHDDSDLSLANGGARESNFLMVVSERTGAVSSYGSFPTALSCPGASAGEGLAVGDAAERHVATGSAASRCNALYAGSIGI